MKPAKKTGEKNAADGTLELFGDIGAARRNDAQNVQPHRPQTAKANSTAHINEEIEAIEELEESIIEAEELLEEDDDLLHSDAHSKNGREALRAAIKKAKSSKTFKTAVQLLSTASIPSLFLNKDFFVLHSTPALYKLFDGYYEIENKPFFNIFKNLLTKIELETFFKNLKSPESGFSWVGTLIHKTKYKKVLYTKTNVFPLFENNTVKGYWVVFEDITDTFISQYKNIIQGFLNASKLKDNDTGFHNERLNFYSKALSEALFETNVFPQIDMSFIDDISILAATHDIGKIGTPDYILQKKGKLTPTEWTIMRDHTISGALILSTYPSDMAKEIALSHHERWDGTGYPYNLSGEMIPLSARIVAIADVYDALRMKRSYKEGIPHDETVEYIVQGSGKQFDPTIIETFKKISGKFGEIWDCFEDADEPEEPRLQ